MTAQQQILTETWQEWSQAQYVLPQLLRRRGAAARCLGVLSPWLRQGCTLPIEPQLALCPGPMLQRKQRVRSFPPSIAPGLQSHCRLAHYLVRLVEPSILIHQRLWNLACKRSLPHITGTSCQTALLAAASRKALGGKCPPCLPEVMCPPTWCAAGFRTSICTD